MNIQFTSIEKITIANILIHMMNSDNDVDVKEVLYFNQIQNRIGMTDQEFRQGKEQNLLISLAVIQSMTDYKKLLLGVMLHEMINADGKVDEKELELFNVVCKAGGIDTLMEKTK